MTYGALYLGLGMKHAVHLIVSITSLRLHYAGPVAIVTDDTGLEVAEWIASDEALGPIQIIRTDMRPGDAGKSYLHKTMLPGISPFDRTLFIDADTLIVGDFREAFPQSSNEIVFTQFADWVSTGGKMVQRIRPWAEVEPARTARMLARPWPALNTGVVGWGESTKAFAADWHDVAKRRPVFMNDEIAAQLIYPDYNSRILGWQDNASVVFDANRADVADARIFHGHGGKFWKKDTGRAIYLPFFRTVVEQNRGNIQAVRLHSKWFGFLPAEDQEWMRRYTGQVA